MERPPTFTAADIAGELNISETTCRRRLRALQDHADLPYTVNEVEGAGSRTHWAWYDEDGNYAMVFALVKDAA